MLHSFELFPPGIEFVSLDIKHRTYLGNHFCNFVHQAWSSGWWFGIFVISPYIGNVIIPIDELIFFRGVGQPPTSHPLVIEGFNGTYPWYGLNGNIIEAKMKFSRFSWSRKSNGTIAQLVYNFNN